MISVVIDVVSASWRKQSLIEVEEVALFQARWIVVAIILGLGWLL